MASTEKHSPVIQFVCAQGEAAVHLPPTFLLPTFPSSSQFVRHIYFRISVFWEGFWISDFSICQNRVSIKSVPLLQHDTLLRALTETCSYSLCIMCIGDSTGKLNCLGNAGECWRDASVPLSHVSCHPQLTKQYPPIRYIRPVIRACLLNNISASTLMKNKLKKKKMFRISAKSIGLDILSRV